MRELERSAEFYGQLLGWKQLPIPYGMPAAAFSGGRTHHELLLIEIGKTAAPASRDHRAGLYHFGLKIGDSDDDLRAALQVIAQYDITLTGMSDHTVTHSLYITDPDGNQIELYIDVPGVDWHTHPELITAPTKPLNL